MRKKDLIRIFLSATVLFAALILFCGCGGNEKETPEENASESQTGESAAVVELLLSEGKNSDYIIVYGNTDVFESKSAATYLAGQLSEKFGAEFSVIDDRKKTKRQDKEIVLGKSEGAPNEYSDTIGIFGYSVKVDGQKIYVDANTSYAYNEAISFLLSSLEQKDGKLYCSVPENILVKDERFGEWNMEHFDLYGKSDVVGICYSIWFDPIVVSPAVAKNMKNISKILAGEQKWGSVNSFHYWGEPALGYYMSSDRSVIRQHMTWLSDAGVDFIIIDMTNTSIGWKQTPCSVPGKTYWQAMISDPMNALLDECRAMRDEGLKTPYVCLWCATHQDGTWKVVNAITSEFFGKEEYSDLWVYWGGNPFVLTTATMNNNPRTDLTYRRMWGLQTVVKSEWSFLAKTKKSEVIYGTNGEPEQVGVFVAAQQTYMSDTKTALGRRNGKTFYNNWKVAFENHPKIVTLTWWNEWAAQRFVDKDGNNLFVDNYNQEYSRDIEPMKDGHGDKYYQWMKQYIAAYKNHEECPKLYD